MIPIHKLKQLPRHQRLRKIANIFEAEDERLSAHTKEIPSSFHQQYIVDVVRSLSEDEEFAPAALEAITNVAAELSDRYAEGRIFDRRSINTLRHIINMVVGKQTADWDFLDGGGRLSIENRGVLPGVYLFLEDIRSPYNVGSIFRAAESFGVERIIISPLCASPEHPRAARTAMGCIDLVPWDRKKLDELEGPFFALETGGIAIDDFSFPERGVLIVGSEELGVSPSALAVAETSLGRVSIPTIGAKGSLNVSVALGIAMHEWYKKLT